MDETKAKILGALVKEERKTFQDISDLFGRYSRTTVRKKLDELLGKRLIKEVNKKEWRKGQKLWFSITAEGEKRILNESVAAAAESLKKVRDLTAHIAQQDPKKLDGLRRLLWKVKEGEEDLEKLEEGTLSIEEYARRSQQRSKDDPLRESYKAIYDIFLKVNCLPHEIPKEGFAVAILEKGSVCLLEVALLRKRGFILREPEKELD
jgi:predicted ArsR family transcriptional regulator